MSRERVIHNIIIKDDSKSVKDPLAKLINPIQAAVFGVLLWSGALFIAVANVRNSKYYSKFMCLFVLLYVFVIVYMLNNF